MEGPQELLSGKFQLCFTPAARTSFLMLRLNDAALRALQECQRQQVRPPLPTPLSFPTSYPAADDPGEGTWGWGATSAGSGLPTSPSEARARDPAGTRRRILGTSLHLRSAPVCALPAGSASDRFPRQPRGKCRPEVCEALGCRENRRGLLFGKVPAGREAESSHGLRSSEN